MNHEELCRTCHHPVKDFASNTTRDRHGELIQCPRCAVVERSIKKQRSKWNQQAKTIIQQMDMGLQECWKYDLEHGTLRELMYTMREDRVSPGDAVRAWRHSVVNPEHTNKNTRQRPNSSQFHVLPQRQYSQSTELPVSFSPTMEVARRPEMSIVWAKALPTIPSTPKPQFNSLQQPRYINWDDVSDTSSDSDDDEWIGHASGVVRDRDGRMAVVVTDSRGNRVRGRSALAWFAT